MPNRGRRPAHRLWRLTVDQEIAGAIEMDPVAINYNATVAASIEKRRQGKMERRVEKRKRDALLNRAKRNGGRGGSGSERKSGRRGTSARNTPTNIYRGDG